MHQKRLLHRPTSLCMFTSGTVSPGCLWTTKSRTLPAQMWPRYCWKTWSSGLIMRLRWLLTTGRVWARSAIRSLSGPCREVSAHMAMLVPSYSRCLFQWVMPAFYFTVKLFFEACQTRIHCLMNAVFFIIQQKTSFFYFTEICPNSQPALTVVQTLCR